MKHLFLSAFTAALCAASAPAFASDLGVSYQVKDASGLDRAWVVSDGGRCDGGSQRVVGPDGVPYDIEVSIDRLEGEKVFATARIYEIKKGLNGRTWGRLVTAQPIATSAGAPSNMTVVVGSAGDAQQSFHLRFTPAGDEAVADNSGAEAVENCARIDPKQRRH